MNRYIFLIVLLWMTILCVSCTQGNERSVSNKKLETELNLLKKTPVSLPPHLEAWTCKDGAKPDTTLLDRPIKMIVYIGKDGCTNCKLRSLLPINMFMIEHRDMKQFGVVVILNTPDKEDTKKILSDLRFRHTVFFDVDGAFEHLNPHVPSDEAFHKFLLGKDNRVVLVGDPTHNEKLNKLYLEVMRKGAN